MSDVEVDPYAVSSDDDDDDTPKGPPPKITIAGRTDMHDIVRLRH
jgi:hypothetical protein